MFHCKTVYISIKRLRYQIYSQNSVKNSRFDVSHHLVEWALNKSEPHITEIAVIMKTENEIRTKTIIQSSRDVHMSLCAN